MQSWELEYNEPRKIFVSPQSPNNIVTVLINGQPSPLQVKKYEDCRVSGYVLRFLSDLYTSPFSSSLLGIGVFELSSEFIADVAFLDKCVSFKTKNIFCFSLC